MREIISLYLTSGKASAVRAQVREELRNLTGYYTRDHADVVIKIVMENHLGLSILYFLHYLPNFNYVVATKEVTDGLVSIAQRFLHYAIIICYSLRLFSVITRLTSASCNFPESRGIQRILETPLCP